MENTRRQSLIWGGLLIIFGALSLQGTFGVNPWMAVGSLAFGGLAVVGLYLFERSQKWLLIPALGLLMVALMIALLELNLLPPALLPSLILLAIAAPFVAAYMRKQERSWGLLIPPYVLLVLALMIPMIEWEVLPGAFVPTYVLGSIALPFVAAFWHGGRARTGLLIPAYVLLAIGVLIPLVERGILRPATLPSYVFLCLALPFLATFARKPERRWALLVGGVFALMGIAFLSFTAIAGTLAPLVLIFAGLALVIDSLVRKGSAND